MWPMLSLIILKPSRSMNKTANDWFLRRLEYLMSRLRRSINNSRFGKPGQRIGDFCLRDVRLRTGHAQRSSRFVTNGEAAAEHPAESSVMMQHAMLALEVRSGAVLMRGDFFFDPGAVGIMNPVEPFFWLVADFRFPENPSIDFQRAEKCTSGLSGMFQSHKPSLEPRAASA